MFRACRRLFSNAPLSIEEWATANSRLTTPDEIIAASILQSFAKDFDNWTHNDLFTGNAEGAAKEAQYLDCKEQTIHHHTKNVSIRRKVKFTTTRYGRVKTAWYGDVYVNDLVMGRKAGLIIATGYFRIIQQVNRAKATANNAKASMERNEKAWDLAETLLGMKRNEHGALVPIEQPEAQEVTNKFNPCTLSCCK